MHKLKCVFLIILSIEILKPRCYIALNNSYDVRKRINCTINIKVNKKGGLLCRQQ